MHTALAIAETPLDAFRALNQAAIVQNIPAMEQRLAPEFVLTHITGYPQPRAEWLDEVKRGSMRYYDFKEVETDLQIAGDHATLISRNLVDANIWGTHHTWRLQQTVTFRKNGDSWLIEKSVATLY
ncbi:MAG: nuclear transport factor 2 family protein [Cardiobacterium sp.]